MSNQDQAATRTLVSLRDAFGGNDGNPTNYRILDNAIIREDALVETLRWIASYASIMRDQSDCPLTANINFGFKEIAARASGVLTVKGTPT